MPKAVVKLPNGTTVEIVGTYEEVQKLLAFYGLPHDLTKTRTAKKKAGPSVEPEHHEGSAGVPTQADLARLVNLVRTCDEAEGIETQVLDRASEVNRVLLPLYIAHEHMDDPFGLTTVEISTITADLGIRVFRQNVLRGLTGSGARYVLGDRVRRKGQATRYRLNRRGVQYIKEVIRGGENAQ